MSQIDDPNIQIIRMFMPEFQEASLELSYWILGGDQPLIESLADDYGPYRYVPHPQFLIDDDMYPTVYERSKNITPQREVTSRCSHCGYATGQTEDPGPSHYKFCVIYWGEGPNPQVDFVNGEDTWNVFVSTRVKDHIEKRKFKKPQFFPENMDESVMPPDKPEYPEREGVYPVGSFWHLIPEFDYKTLHVGPKKPKEHCKNCSAGIDCPLCGPSLTSCLNCKTKFIYRTVYPEDKFFKPMNPTYWDGTKKIYMSAMNWKGDELIFSDSLLLVTGNVLESFLETGFTGFAYGSCITELAGMSNEMRKIAKEKSRKIDI